MFYILFHIIGIMLLETSFFFYYIGPMETDMFKSKLLQIVEQPVFIPPSTSNISFPFHTSDIISTIIYYYYNETIKDTEDNLYTQSCLGKERRNQQNYELFIFTIKCWGSFTLFWLLAYIIYIKYKDYHSYKKYSGLTTIGLSSPSQLTYRKGSIDDYESELPISSLQKKDEALTKTIQYIGFCGLLVLFQYLFFNYIVFLYNPLSIDEAKYIIYLQAFPQLDKAD